MSLKKSYVKTTNSLQVLLVLTGIITLIATSVLLVKNKSTNWETYTDSISSYSISYPKTAQIENYPTPNEEGNKEGQALQINFPNGSIDIGLKSHVGPTGYGYDPEHPPTTTPYKVKIGDEEVIDTETIEASGSSYATFKHNEYSFYVSFKDQNQETKNQAAAILATFKIH